MFKELYLKSIKLAGHKGSKLFLIIDPLIEKEENIVFNKLNNETINFINSLRLLLGKKIRIKSDLLTERLEDIIQWSQTKFENL